MVSYFVSYCGSTPDPQAFVERYAGEHVPLLAAWPGIRSVVLHTPVGWNDPFPVNPGGRLLLAQMTFDSSAALDAALGSPARARARDDVVHFPPFDGQVTHQATATRKVFG